MAECSREEIGSTIQIFSGNAHPDIPSMSSLPSSEIEASINSKQQQADPHLLADSGTYNEGSELNVHCRCPCGRTDFSHCVIRPPPECLNNRHTNTQTFPELDLTIGADTIEARVAIKQYLLAETESLKQAFTDYGLAVHRYAKSIEGIKGSLVEIVELQGQAHAISETNFDDLYRAARKGANFLNCEPLKCILRECNQISGKVPALSEEEKYEEAFRRFAQYRVFSFMGGLQECLPIQEGTYKSLKIKVEEDVRTFVVDRIYHFKRVIRETLGIPKQVFLQVTDIQEGCIEITFNVVGNIVAHSTLEMDKMKKKALAFNNISMLEYCGDVYYCCCELLAVEPSSNVLKNLYHIDKTQDHLAQNDEEDHSPDCPYIQDKKMKCPLKKCDHCGTQVNFCCFECHLWECEEKVSISDHTTFRDGPPLPSPDGYLKSDKYQSTLMSKLDANKSQSTLLLQEVKEILPELCEMLPCGSHSPLTDHNDLVVDLPKKVKSSHLSYSEPAKNKEDNADLTLSSQSSPLMSPVDVTSQQQHFYCNNDKGEAVINVSPTIKRKRMHRASSSVDSTPVVNVPSCEIRVSSIESQQNSDAGEGAREMCGYCASSYREWDKMESILKRPSNREIGESVNGKEVVPSLKSLMHLHLPPRRDCDSAFSSLVSSPNISSQERELSSDIGYRCSFGSDSGVSTATLDTPYYNSDSNETLADDAVEAENGLHLSFQYNLSST